eukprot:TRINITY_DN318_c1_g2_i2.p1 TRINITY_DN318_c1_g2~~TRINITY_DN318_c1_g2_i2.p1  ORF type:complete len:349 (-),score=111.65 TRINITY_DN318_c1_g2_i2:434-1480(-)
MSILGNKYVYTDGRPPWYHMDGSKMKPFVIGICGGSASGKTSVCNEVIRLLNVPWVAVLSQDSFYKGLSHEQISSVASYNFDHPNAFDWDLMVETLSSLKEGKIIDVPVYDFKTHSRSKETKQIYGADVIIFEGIMIFHSPELRNHFDMKIFVDSDSDVRLARRIKRDVAERGRDLEGIISQYFKFVKPSFDDYIMPTMKFADIILPRGLENIVAINLIVDDIRDKLKKRGLLENVWDTNKLTTIPPSVRLLPSTHQIKAMMTILRNRDTTIDDFIFYSDRITRLLFELALDTLPSIHRDVITPTELPYHGSTLEMDKVLSTFNLKFNLNLNFNLKVSTSIHLNGLML